VYVILWRTEFVRQELKIDDGYGRLHQALQTTYNALRADPFIGELADPLRGLFILRISAMLGLLPLELTYRVSVEGEVVEMVAIEVVKNP
jgi:hypothetical protein